MTGKLGAAERALKAGQPGRLPEDVAAVVLETDGSLSVVRAAGEAQEATVLRGLNRAGAT